MYTVPNVLIFCKNFHQCNADKAFCAKNFSLNFSITHSFVKHVHHMGLFTIILASVQLCIFFWFIVCWRGRQRGRITAIIFHCSLENDHCCVLYARYRLGCCIFCFLVVYRECWGGFIAIYSLHISRLLNLSTAPFTNLCRSWEPVTVPKKLIGKGATQYRVYFTFTGI